MTLPLLALPLTPEPEPQSVEYVHTFRFADCTPFFGVATFTAAYIDTSERVMKKLKKRNPDREPSGVRRRALFCVVIKQTNEEGNSITLFVIRGGDVFSSVDDPTPTMRPVALQVASGSIWNKAANCNNSFKKIIPATIFMLRKLFPNLVRVDYNDQAILGYDDDGDEALGLARMQTYTTVNEFERELDKVIYRVRYYLQLGFTFYDPVITVSDFERARTEAAQELLNRVQRGDTLHMGDVYDTSSLRPWWKADPKFRGDLVKIAAMWTVG